ncbi:MAG: RIP metalloprotease RseP [Steroidobacteraceae bacterium]
MAPDSPLEFLIAAAAFIVAIGVLVTVHEFGHFWVARKLGIRVLRFSIGFGPALWKRTLGKDPVEYMVSVLPLGGYVKLLDEREGDVAPEDLPRAFNRQPVWKRIAVLLAGVVFNLLFAIFVYWILFTAGVPTLKPVIGDVAADSPAARAGLKFEDQIVAIAGEPVTTLDETVLLLVRDMVDDGVINLRVRGVNQPERSASIDVGNRSRELTEPDALFPGLGFDFWRPRVAADIGAFAPDSPAEKAGLRKGDEIVKVDGVAVADFSQLARKIEPAAGRVVNLEVRRDGALLALPVKVGEQVVGERHIGRIGVQPTNRIIDSGRTIAEIQTVQKYGPLESVGAATRETWNKAAFTLRMLGRMFSGDVSIKAMSGPISIAELTGYAARQEWRAYLNVLAVISISLAVINLLPIPILDGGQIVFQLAELVKGTPVSERALMLSQQIGMAMMLIFMTLVFYNDIARHLN